MVGDVGVGVGGWRTWRLQIRMWRMGKLKMPGE